MKIADYFNNKFHLDLYQNEERYIDFLDIFNLLNGKGKKALDIGCSSGGFSSKLSKLGYDVIGIDIADKSVERAKKNFLAISFYNADILEWQTKEKFDYIFGMFDLLSFIMKKKLRIKALSIMYDLLKDNGKIYLTFMKPTWKTYIRSVLYKITHPAREFLDAEQKHFKTKEALSKHNTIKKEIIEYCKELNISTNIIEKDKIFIAIIKKENKKK